MLFVNMLDNLVHWSAILHHLGDVGCDLNLGVIIAFAHVEFESKAFEFHSDILMFMGVNHYGCSVWKQTRHGHVVVPLYSLNLSPHIIQLDVAMVDNSV